MDTPNKSHTVDEAVENAMNINTDPTSGSIKNKDEEKLTLDKEADLTVQDVEQMEWEHAQNGYKGSSGPEEKDIAV